MRPRPLRVGGGAWGRDPRPAGPGAPPPLPGNRGHARPPRPRASPLGVSRCGDGLSGYRESASLQHGAVPAALGGPAVSMHL